MVRKPEEIQGVLVSMLASASLGFAESWNNDEDSNVDTPGVITGVIQAQIAAILNTFETFEKALKEHKCEHGCNHYEQVLVLTVDTLQDLILVISTEAGPKRDLLVDQLQQKYRKPAEKGN
jgi:hypothetical protein